MAISDKIIQINQVKQDIKQAIENKGIPMTNVAFTEYANKIADISGGGGEISLNDFWQEYKGVIYDYKRTTELKYDLNLTFELSLDGFLDVYSGDSVLTQLYNDCVNEVIQVNELYPIDNQIFPKVALMYQGDMSPLLDWPTPLYYLGSFESFPEEIGNSFIFLSDLTPLGMGVGISLLAVPMDLKFTNIKIFKQYENYEQGLIADLSEVTAFPEIQHADFPLCIVDNVEEIVDSAFSYWGANNQPLVIPNSVTSIGQFAFRNWTSNNQPLVIPNSITSIGDYAFWGWTSNNQPLVIGNSVTSIGEGAFIEWTSNNHPLVIPDSVASIGSNAFLGWTSNNQPLVIGSGVTSIGNSVFNNWGNIPHAEIHAITPPTLDMGNFIGSYPIYVPDASLNAYKTATNWSVLASRIFPISEK